MTGEAAPLARLDLGAVAEWITRQRWYGSKSRGVGALGLRATASISRTPEVSLALTRVVYEGGGSECYQLVLGPAPMLDAVADPELARELLRAIDAELTAGDGDGGVVRFRRGDPTGTPLDVDAPARPIGVEQSNSSIVFGDTTVLKVLRRLEPGINPELEVVRFLTRRRFSSIAALQGWYEWEGRFEATLGVAQRFFADAVGGWELAVDQIRSDPAAMLSELSGLGAVTGRLHNALASDPDDPAFAPQAPDPLAVTRLAASIDADTTAIFARLPDDPRIAPIAGRGDELRALIAGRARAAAAVAAQTGAGGRVIRTHGDYHLGQTLRRVDGGAARSGAIGSDWVIIDFEGEPARPVSERRRKTTPLRDVAGMLRSLDYASAAAALRHGGGAPAGFAARARATFLENYLATVDPALLPTGGTAIADLLSVLELEKVVYELRYELDNRPDWLPIPVAAIARLLES